MQLGAFSVSLAVKDLGTSRSFYEALGFVTIGGDAEKNWLILKNGSTVIGLFQGMFEKNILTFNPGWDQDSRTLANFLDIREIQKALKSHGLAPVQDIDNDGTAPASFVVMDPDGNPVLFDQHIDSGKR